MKYITVKLTEDQAHLTLRALNMLYTELELGREKAYVWRVIHKLAMAVKAKNS